MSSLVGNLLVLTVLNQNPEHECISVQGGKYVVGQKGNPQSPIRTATVQGYKIAVYETTNIQFAAFVKATKYVTDVERLHNAMTFRPPLREFQWIKDKTAYWRFPNGLKQGGIQDKMDHPVTCISYRDALAYCKWAGGRLPTIDEWEIATRAGTKGDRFFGGDISKILTYGNVWHRADHLQPDLTDGYVYTSPVGSFAPNPWGLHDVYGNVFEFCSGKLPGERAPKVAKTAYARGGSWWCSKKTCCSFNSFDLGEASIYSSFSNQGFRIVYDLPRQKKPKLK